MLQQISLSTTSDWTKRATLLCVIAAVFAVFAALTFRLCKPMQLSPDCALYLHCGKELLSGAVPYRDLWDCNPPTIMYLSALPAIFASFASLHPIVSFIWVIFFLTLASLLTLSWSVLNQTQTEDRATGSAFVLSFGLASLYLSISWLFGQREHIFVLCYFPLLYLRFCRHRGSRISVLFAVLVGLLAGVGFSLKPFFLILLAAPEITYGWSKFKSNLLKPELIAAAFVVAIFALQMCLAPPDARDTFFNLLVPLMVAGYKAYDSTLVKAATTCTQWQWLLLTLPMAFFLRKRSPLIPALALYTAAAYTLVLYQHKGFPYHPIPEVVGLMVLGAVELQCIGAMLLERMKTKSATSIAPVFLCAIPAAVAIGCMAVAGLNIYKIVRTGSVQENTVAQLSTPAARVLLQKTAADDSVICADLGWTLQYPLLLQTGRKVGTRFYTFFAFGLCEYIKENPDHRRFSTDRLNQLEAQFASQLTEDISRNRPRLIFLKSDKCWPMGDEFNLYKLLTSFKPVNEILAKNYCPAGTLDGYTVFERKDHAARGSNHNHDGLVSYEAASSGPRTRLSQHNE